MAMRRGAAARWQTASPAPSITETFSLLADGVSPLAAHLPGKLPLQHFPGVTQLLVSAKNSGRLVTRLHHAILAARVASTSIILPRCLLNKLGKCGVMRVGH